jgi:predicted PP-loop superfamily ATPase
MFIYYFISNFPIFFSFYYQKYININVNRNIIFQFIYGCKTCCIILSEEHTLRAFENRVLREIFVVEKNWETVDCRSLSSGELLDQYC